MQTIPIEQRDIFEHLATTDPLVGREAVFTSFEGEEIRGPVYRVECGFAFVDLGNGRHGRVWAEDVCNQLGLSINAYRLCIDWAAR